MRPDTQKSKEIGAFVVYLLIICLVLLLEVAAVKSKILSPGVRSVPLHSGIVFYFTLHTSYLILAQTYFGVDFTLIL
jgi:hypothetical protein